MSEGLSLQSNLLEKLNRIREDEKYSVTPSVMYLEEDVAEAKELGISVEEFVNWKSGFHDTYVVAQVVPIESFDSRDFFMYRDHPHIRRANRLFCKQFRKRKWKPNHFPVHTYVK